jgi:hypothetical protein
VTVTARRLAVCVSCGLIADAWGTGGHRPDCMGGAPIVRPLIGLVAPWSPDVFEAVGTASRATPEEMAEVRAWADRFRPVELPPLGSPWRSITKPGIYVMPANVYRADPVRGGSLSRSGAKSMLPPSCPAKYIHEHDHGRPEKDTFDYGHAAHRVVLGEGADIAPAPPEFADWRKKAAGEFKRAAYAAGKVPLLASQHERVLDMAAALLDDEDAARAFAPGTGLAEVVLIWRDVQTGVMLRVMVDWLPHPTPERRFVFADYKSCERADLLAVARAIDDFRYHWQLDWIETGIVELGIDDDPCGILVFQEKNPPYVVTMGQPDDRSRTIAAARNRQAINLFRECSDANVWPKYVAGIAEIALPGYSEAREWREVSQ